MTTCPICEGSGRKLAFINRGPDIRTHSLEEIPCTLCNGAGSLTNEQLRRVEIGNAMRAERVAQGKSLLEASRELGCSPAELSNWEIRGIPVSEQRAEQDRKWIEQHGWDEQG